MSLKPCTTCGPIPPKPSPSPLKPCTTCKPTLSPPKPSPYKKEKKFITCDSDPPQEETYCCGEGYIVFPGPCNSLIRSKWVSEADPSKVEATVEKLLQGFAALYNGPVIIPSDPTSLNRILALGIFCDHSTVLTTSVATSGIGTSADIYGAAYQLAVLLQQLKALNGYLEFVVHQRLQENDLLYLTISFLVYDTPPSNPARILLRRVNLFGQWYISQCGTGLCIDWLNISNSV